MGLNAFVPTWKTHGLVKSNSLERHHTGKLVSAQRPTRQRHVVSAPLMKAAEQRVLVLGGTGRVGTETIKALARITPVPLSISVAGRDRSKGHRICRMLTTSNQNERTDLPPVDYHFKSVDITDESALIKLIKAHDVVIHTAGPFQRSKNPTGVLEAAMQANVPYMDICDDLIHAKECKKLHEVALSKGYTALISTGIYPGLSNLMAVEAASLMGTEPVKSLKIYYHTAGTGGIGATVLASTFLILSEHATCFDTHGREQKLPPAGNPEVIDFGGKLGKVTTYLLNLPEVVSLHENVFNGSPGTEIFAKFSTGPPIWNWLLQMMARRTPKSWLANRPAMLAFSKFSLPVVRAVDLLSGALTAMKIVAEGPTSSIIYSFEHDSLAECVGEATASFAVELVKKRLEGGQKGLAPGINYPEELSPDIRKHIIKNASRSANLFESTRYSSGRNWE
ncbi:unnamed protein product [Chondrus crispus]|uniref:Saccharopine dehydrogenase NADP binding domain-containing protein n=1 Tax=Chondrus crispus TaxID=2769 RepID=R7QCP1_CHOCR|nr:unnamed protein product [Chondrus crispus]CDF35518.1 unnamed protein product [Chondrus crispus]|eukprot:XP_005715337.1 unnamed protein product [Chondrus crispus]